MLKEDITITTYLDNVANAERILYEFVQGDEVVQRLFEEHLKKIGVDWFSKTVEAIDLAGAIKNRRRHCHKIHGDNV